MTIFFYGLFMDRALLAEKGIIPANIRAGYIEDYALRIGARASLMRSIGDRAYGLVMEIDPSDVKRLYSDQSVQDYIPEPVTVKLKAGNEIAATCYNLPESKIKGANKEYAKKLYALAQKLDFPEEYLAEILLK